MSFLNTTLVNVQREAVLLQDQIEELPTTGDLKGVTVRRGLLGNQLFQIEGRAAATRGHRGDPAGPPGPGPDRPPAGQDQGGPSTANAIVKLSHTLQLHTVAEGIEQAGQAAHLPTAQPAGSLSV